VRIARVDVFGYGLRYAHGEYVMSGGRSAIWSGACSSGGAKRTNCTFTISGAASVAANVQ